MPHVLYEMNGPFSRTVTSRRGSRRLARDPAVSPAALPPIMSILSIRRCPTPYQKYFSLSVTQEPGSLGAGPFDRDVKVVGPHSSAPDTGPLDQFRKLSFRKTGAHRRVKRRSQLIWVMCPVCCQVPGKSEPGSAAEDLE